MPLSRLKRKDAGLARISSLRTTTKKVIIPNLCILMRTARGKATGPTERHQQIKTREKNI